MIDALCKEGKLDNGMKLLSEMSNKIVWPNVVTYNVIVDGIGSGKGFIYDLLGYI